MLKAIIPCAFALTVIVHNTKAHADDYERRLDNEYGRIVRAYQACAYPARCSDDFTNKLGAQGDTLDMLRRIHNDN